MMHINQRKEQYSFAYIRAVAAAAAGYTVDERSVDDDSVDLQISSRSKLGTVKSPKLELQAKCLGEGLLKDDDFNYPLKLKNYDDLRDQDVQVPRILVVVRVPTDDAEWISGSDDSLIVRHCAYWLSLRGLPAYSGNAKESDNAKVTVRLPQVQRFDVDGLRAIMDRVGRKELP
jgi:Domain of unknown function (DUF4365)